MGEQSQDSDLDLLEVFLSAESTFRFGLCLYRDNGIIGHADASRGEQVGCDLTYKSTQGYTLTHKNFVEERP